MMHFLRKPYNDVKHGVWKYPKKKFLLENQFFKYLRGWPNKFWMEIFQIINLKFDTLEF